MKKTLILGASENPSRYAYRAAHMLKNSGHEIVPIGRRNGQVAGEHILTEKEVKKEIDTITLYLNAKNQEEWYDYILSTKPNRIIFNPGTENPNLKKLAEEHQIETINACTLVMLSVGNY
ncbi:CoA-binding protein [Flexithrix dorotheae]|uniref:CoA-binding protein n=1 Tax=Flexithrix dorotheae TaxID=70993 RepID=UPI00035DD4DA|nr:CoA-binding protein [Flexithrix dorotheae]